MGEEALKKRKEKWEDDCVSRMSKGEEAITFEDWDKKRLDKLKAEEEEATRRRKEERKKAKISQKTDVKEKDGDDDDEDEFTERELAEMRGYKKTADGRVTSYFTREQSVEERAMLDIAPKPISDCMPQPITPSSSKGDSTSSAWNHAGTCRNITTELKFFFPNLLTFYMRLLST